MVRKLVHCTTQPEAGRVSRCWLQLVALHYSTKAGGFQMFASARALHMTALLLVSEYFRCILEVLSISGSIQKLSGVQKLIQKCEHSPESECRG